MKEEQRSYLGVWGYVKPSDGENNRGVMECQPGPSRGGRIVTITPENLHPLYSPSVSAQGITPLHAPVPSIHTAVSACGMNLPVHPGPPVNLPPHHPGLVGPPGLGPGPHGYHRPSVDHLAPLHHPGAQLQHQQLVSSAGSQLQAPQHMLGDLHVNQGTSGQQTTDQPEEEEEDEELREDDIIDDVDDGPADETSQGDGLCKSGPSNEGESGRKEQHRLLTLEQKRELIRMSEEERVKARDLMELFSIGKTQVYAILKQRNHIKEEFSQAKNEHEKQAKRKIRFTGNEEIDEIVHRWYVGARSKNMFVTGTQLKEHAKVVADALGRRSFKASNGWLECFRKRHNIIIPRSKNAKDNAQLRTPEHGDFGSLQTLWAQQLQMHICDYSEANIYCLDMTTLHYQATPRCINSELGDALYPPGPKLSLLLCASATGEKEFPLVVGNAQLLPQFVNRMKIIFRRSQTPDGEISAECIEEFIRGLSDRMRRENRSIVLFLLLPVRAHFVLGKHFANVKLVHWQQANASMQPMQQGVFHRFKLSYRILALRNMIANGGPQAISLVDALQYISRVWHHNIIEVSIRKAFYKAGFPVYLQNSFDNLSRETDVTEELRELQRLVGVYSGESSPDLARNYVELERSVERDGYCETGNPHHLSTGYGGYGASALTDEYGNLFGVGHSDDPLALAPAISSYQGALIELRRLQQFALKVNDYELQEILFNARCAAEDRSAARVIAEKYLNIMQ